MPPADSGVAISSPARFQKQGRRRQPTEMWQVPSTHQRGTCQVSTERDRVEDVQSHGVLKFKFMCAARAACNCKRNGGVPERTGNVSWALLYQVLTFPEWGNTLSNWRIFLSPKSLIRLTFDCSVAAPKSSSSSVHHCQLLQLFNHVHGILGIIC